MNSVMNKWRLIGMVAGIATTIVVLGCGGDDSGLDRRYKVSGTVKYKGEPVGKGTIAFEPTNPAPPAGRLASGFIENGYYTLTTAVEGDGVLAGEYKVVISALTVYMTGLAKQSGGMVHQGDKDFQKIVKEAKNLVPAKYAKSETSGLTKKVEARSQTVDFDLTD